MNALLFINERATVDAGPKPPSSGLIRSLLLICLVISSAQGGVRSLLPDAEYQALIDLHNSLGGSGWWKPNVPGAPVLRYSNWLNPEAAFWEGVTITDFTRYSGPGVPSGPIEFHVTGIDLTGSHLSGKIPPSIANLAKLVSLQLGGNQISGSIPTSLVQLANLSFLDLHANLFTGEIPAGLAELPFWDLNVGNNFLTGEIPYISWKPPFTQMHSYGFALNCFDIQQGSPAKANIERMVKDGKHVAYLPQRVDCQTAETISGELTVLDANPSFLDNLIVPLNAFTTEAVSALVKASLSRDKAVADGATRLLLRWESDAPGTVSFSQNGPADSQLTSVIDSSRPIVPQRTVRLNDKYYAFALYRTPEGIPFKQKNNILLPTPAVTLLASFVPDSLPSRTLDRLKTIRLGPTPVLLIHGLWGKRRDWHDLEADLKQYAVRVYNVDYSGSNSGSFFRNSTIVHENSERFLTDLREELGGYAVTRIDVVAHSMGGILTRIASNLPDYRSKHNFNEGYIRRVITVDTPHHGSPSASFLLRYLASFSNQIDYKWRMYAMRAFGKDPYGGAVKDLDPHSFASSLGGVVNPATSAMRIPANALFCEATEAGDVDEDWEVGVAVSPVYGWLKDFLDEDLLKRNPALAAFREKFIVAERRWLGQLPLSNASYLSLWKIIFSGQRNDGSVAVDSQKGNSSSTTERLGVSHVSAPHNLNVRRDIIRLLNDPVGENFALNGLPGVTKEKDLFDQNGWYSSIPQQATARLLAVAPNPEDLEVHFELPENGSSVAGGQMMPFSLNIRAGQQWSNVVVALMSSSEAYGTLTFTNPPLVGEFMCPSNLLGSAELVAITRGENASFGTARIGFSIGQPQGVSLVAMSATPAAIALQGLDEKLAVDVEGEFSDGIKRNISDGSTGTSYRVGNASIVAVDISGVVTARGQGETWIEVVNGDVSNRIPATVKFKPPEILAVWPPKIASSTPASVSLSISGLRFGGTSALEILHDGLPANGLTLSALERDSSQRFMTAILTVGQNARPGSYRIVVTTPGGRSDASENKGAVFTIDGPVTLAASSGARQTLTISVSDALERTFILETAQELGVWSPFLTNATVGGRWETNGITINGSRFFRARIHD